MDGKHSNPLARWVVALAVFWLVAAGACGSPPEDADDADPLPDTLASAESIADLPPDTAEQTPPPVAGRGLRAELEAQG
ncbi:MAG TPA: hypothetical protein VFS53_03995, partial [Gemmatimonadota bacterium]|nr:hypothetical protein [Gemmatimonadota bacterium]